MSKKQNAFSFISPCMGTAIVCSMAALFAACSDTVENNINQMGMDVVASEDDLPKCTKDNEGEQAFVKDEDATRVCVSGEWKPVLPSGSTIETDFSCKTEELKDKSGLKIVCNGDSIGVVLNGAEGKQGETGVGCTISGQTDSTVTIACGDKKLTMNMDGGFSVIEAENDSEKVAISLDSLAGYTQKGPFLKGSTVYLYELSDGRTLKQTNGNFTSKITRDDGHYKFTARDLVSQYAMLVVDGFYRNEVTGQKSDASLRLTALTDMRKRSSANVNLLTHLEFDRVYQLVTRGDSTGKKLTVKQAKRQAQKEILKQFHIELDSTTDAEDMDVFGNTDADAALLAVSILLQGDSGTTDLSVLLTEISNDIAEFGEWKNDSAKAVFADWAYVADSAGRFAKFGTNVTNWGLGDAPDFAKFLRNYWLKEYGIEDCVSAIEDKVIAIRHDKFYCSANGWTRIATGWSWDYPKEAYSNLQIEYGSMTDERDNKKYRTVLIGDQTWFAENLNYADSTKTPSLKGKSWCYDDVAKNCDVAGRLYAWTAAIDSVKLATNEDNPQDCGYVKTCSLPTKVQGICPTGWHLPSVSDWETLFTAVGGQSTAGKVLKSANGWGGSANGTDAFGFAALPVGSRVPNGDLGYDGSFYNGARDADFWSSTEYDIYLAHEMSLTGSSYEGAGLGIDNKRKALPIRCVKD